MSIDKCTKAIITDYDNNEVVGIFCVEGMSHEQVCSKILSIEAELEGEWTTEDLIEGLKQTCEDSGKEYLWLTDVYSVYI